MTVIVREEETLIVREQDGVIVQVAGDCCPLDPAQSAATIASIADLQTQIDALKAAATQGPIAYVGIGTVAKSNGTSPNTLTPTLPGGLVTGDFMLCLWHAGNSGKTAVFPAGWTLILRNTLSSRPTQILAYKFYVVGDTNPAITDDCILDDNPIASIAAFRHVDPDYLDIQGAVLQGASATTATPVVGQTTRYKGDLVIAIKGWRFNRTVGVSTGDGGLTWAEMEQENGVSANLGGMAWDYTIVGAQTATIEDKTYTFSGLSGGHSCQILSFASAPKLAIPNTILREDLATAADPIPLWKQITSADATQSAANLLATQQTASPSPFIAVGKTVASSAYRRLKCIAYALNASTDISAASIVVSTAISADTPTSGTLWIGDEGGGEGDQVTYTGWTGSTFTGCTGGVGTFAAGKRVSVQDVYDAGVGQHSTRTQLINNSQTNTFWNYAYGQFVTTLMDIKVQQPLPLTAADEETQIWQIKQAGSAPYSPIISMVAYYNRLELLHDPYDTSIEVMTTISPVPTDWFRLAVRVYIHPTLGTLEAWYKPNIGSAYTHLFGPVTRRTGYNTGEVANVLNSNTLSIGVYHETRQPTMHCEYANVQIIQSWDGVL